MSNYVEKSGEDPIDVLIRKMYEYIEKHTTLTVKTEMERKEEST